MSRPGVVSGSLLVFSLALGSLVAPAVLGGPRDAMNGNVIYEEVMSSLWPFAAAIALMLLVVTSATMAVYLRYSRKLARRRGREMRISLAYRSLVLLIAAFLLALVVVVASVSLADSGGARLPPRGISLR